MAYSSRNISDNDDLKRSCHRDSRNEMYRAEKD